MESHTTVDKEVTGEDDVTTELSPNLNGKGSVDDGFDLITGRPSQGCESSEANPVIATGSQFLSTVSFEEEDIENQRILLEQFNIASSQDDCDAAKTSAEINGDDDDDDDDNDDNLYVACIPAGRSSPHLQGGQFCCGTSQKYSCHSSLRQDDSTDEFELFENFEKSQDGEKCRNFASGADSHRGLSFSGVDSDDEDDYRRSSYHPRGKQKKQKCQLEKCDKHRHYNSRRVELEDIQDSADMDQQSGIKYGIEYHRHTLDKKYGKSLQMRAEGHKQLQRNIDQGSRMSRRERLESENELFEPLEPQHIFEPEFNEFNRQQEFEQPQLQYIKEFQGPQDFQGYQDLQENQPIQGLQGFKGHNSLQGHNGLQDLEGYQEFQGLQGNEAIKGHKGHQEFQGHQELQEVDGLQGLQKLSEIHEPSLEKAASRQLTSFLLSKQEQADQEQEHYLPSKQEQADQEQEHYLPSKQEQADQEQKHYLPSKQEQADQEQEHYRPSKQEDADHIVQRLIDSVSKCDSNQENSFYQTRKDFKLTNGGYNDKYVKMQQEKHMHMYMESPEEDNKRHVLQNTQPELMKKEEIISRKHQSNKIENENQDLQQETKKEEIEIRSIQTGIKEKDVKCIQLQNQFEIKHRKHSQRQLKQTERDASFLPSTRLLPLSVNPSLATTATSAGGSMENAADQLPIVSSESEGSTCLKKYAMENRRMFLIRDKIEAREGDVATVSYERCKDAAEACGKMQWKNEQGEKWDMERKLEPTTDESINQSINKGLTSVSSPESNIRDVTKQPSDCKCENNNNDKIGKTESHTEKYLCDNDVDSAYRDDISGAGFDWACSNEVEREGHNVKNTVSAQRLTERKKVRKQQHDPVCRNNIGKVGNDFEIRHCAGDDNTDDVRSKYDIDNYDDDVRSTHGLGDKDTSTTRGRRGDDHGSRDDNGSRGRRGQGTDDNGSCDRRGLGSDDNGSRVRRGLSSDGNGSRVRRVLSSDDNGSRGRRGLDNDDNDGSSVYVDCDDGRNDSESDNGDDDVVLPAYYDCTRPLPDDDYDDDDDDEAANDDVDGEIKGQGRETNLNIDLNIFRRIYQTRTNDWYRTRLWEAERQVTWYRKQMIESYNEREASSLLHHQREAGWMRRVSKLRAELLHVNHRLRHALSATAARNIKLKTIKDVSHFSATPLPANI